MNSDIVDSDALKKMMCIPPNRHYNNFDTKPFQKVVPGENNDVLIPLNKPYGVVFAQQARKDLKSHFY